MKTLNISTYETTNPNSAKLTKKQKVPFVKKPLVAFSYLYKELPKQKTYVPESESLWDTLFGSTKKAEKSSSRVAEQTKTQTVTKTEQKTTYKPATIYDTKTEYTYATQTKEKGFRNLKLGHLAKEGAKAVAIGIVKTIGWTLIMTVRALGFTTWVVKKAITVPLAFAADQIEKVKNDRIRKVRAERLKLQKENDLKNLQAEFSEKLKQYKKLFVKEGMKPDFAQYNNYSALSYENLHRLFYELNNDYGRQLNIIQVKKAITKGADGFFGGGGGGNGESPLKCSLMEIAPRKQVYTDKKEYLSEFARLCKNYLENSKNVENPMLKFNEIIKNYFAHSSGALREIFEMPEKKQHIKFGPFEGNVKTKWLERIPKLGIIPKGLRVYEQFSLANCIMDDFDAIFGKHVQHGIHPGMIKYGNQYKTIESFANGHRGQFDAKTDEQVEKLLKTTKSACDNRCKAYTKMFDRFTVGGTNLKKACKNIKLKGGVAMGMKSFLTMLPALT